MEAEPFVRLGECKVFDLDEFWFGRREEVIGTYGGYEMRRGDVFVIHRPTKKGYRIRRRTIPLVVQRWLSKEGARNDQDSH